MISVLYIYLVYTCCRHRISPNAKASREQTIMTIVWPALDRQRDRFAKLNFRVLLILNYVPVETQYELVRRFRYEKYKLIARWLQSSLTARRQTYKGNGTENILALLYSDFQVTHNPQHIYFNSIQISTIAQWYRPLRLTVMARTDG